MSKTKKSVFSLLKAVKANARERLGSPPPERVIPNTRGDRDRVQPKYKETLTDLLAGKGDDRV